MSTLHYTSPSSRRSPRAKLLTAVGVILAAVVVFFGYREYRKSIEFEGVVVEKERSARWDRLFDVTGPEYRRYRHYLVLENETGEQRRLRVSWRTHGRAEVGDPVVKESGDYWPKLMTEEAIRNREVSREAVDMIFDAVTGQDQDRE